ncbi:MAG: peptidoglycan-associated lipoprotein Pal [Pseudomonadota bacterium]|nr:peptidoglycan-associated lipoprotein Pal [Pseudomonadota bacterium]
MKTISGVLLISLLWGCSSQPTQPTGAEDRSAGSGAAKDSLKTVETMPTLNPLTDPNNILSKRSVYFDYDSHSGRNEYKPLVQSHAQYLRDHPNAKVLLQGNTDDRGSREYNLALGQRRADSVRNAMTLTGAKEAQIESASLGEEKPRATGHDEASWAENRRVDIRYQGE